MTQEESQLGGSEPNEQKKQNNKTHAAEILAILIKRGNPAGMVCLIMSKPKFSEKITVPCTLEGYRSRYTPPLGMSSMKCSGLRNSCPRGENNWGVNFLRLWHVGVIGMPMKCRGEI